MELVRFPSRGGFSVRSIIMLCLTVLLTGLLWVILGATPAHAADTDAVWSGDVILYDNHGYIAPNEVLNTSHGLPAGTTMYLYIPVVNGSTANSKTAYFIYFAPGTDPPTATSAEYVAYDYDGTNFSNPHDKKTLSLELKGTSDSSSCSVSIGGLGWIICPVSTFLAESMDSLFDIVSGFIAVRPLTLQTGNDNGLYTAWNIMRNIANVAFVIAFLIIIYSQLTSLGVSNYSLKKMIPRLIVAAVLVNLSFYISALAIDISNVAGYSIQDIFNAIREQIFHVTNDTVGNTLTQSWTGLTAGILSGGGAIVGGLYILANPGALYLLIPLLLTLLLTIFMVVVVLAARQAIIILLVILAPLAFVANLLPNTEKLFERWRGLFTTMLVFFPAFSVIFGGSQLAGQLIIQNAAGNMIMVLFGMAVQIAPLIVTPLILKFSGSTLGKIAQIVNNPKKGLLDRNRNWANDRSTWARNRAAGRDLSTPPTGRLGRFRRAAITPGTRMVQGSERRRRALKEGIEMHVQHAENRYKESARHRRLHEGMAGAEMDKETIGNRNNTHIEHLKVTPGSSLYGRTTNVQVSKDNLEASQNATAAYLNRQRINSASPLHGSNLNLEASKSILETTDNRVKAYVAQQRTLAGGALRHTVAPLEESKLHLQSAQDQYTAMVTRMQAVPGSTMSDAAFTAQASKEAVELAQARLQAQFDDRRRVVGSELNTSMLDLELNKRTAEASKSLTDAYLNAQKLAVGTTLHAETVRAEQAKIDNQVAETRVTKMVEEYKSGERAADGLLTGTGIVENMVYGVEDLAAENRGVQSAQNRQKKHIANAFGETIPGTDIPTARANDLLDAAASVDPDGRTRALANAMAQEDAIDQEARKNNQTLLEGLAQRSGLRPIEYATNLYKRFRGSVDPVTGAVTPPQPVDESMLEAALDLIAADSGIPTIREALTKLPAGSPLRAVDPDMMRRVVGRNNTPLMSKGGADIVLNNLSDVSAEQMDISIAGNLSGIKGTDISGIKFGEWDYLSKPANLERILNTTAAVAPDGVFNKRSQASYLEGLEGFYNVITNSLQSNEIFNSLSATQQQQTIAIHRILHGRYANPLNEITDYDALGK